MSPSRPSRPSLQAKVRAREGEEAEEEVENFIQDDDGGGDDDDDDEFGMEWGLNKRPTSAALKRPESGVHRRPDSAINNMKVIEMKMPRPPCPTVDRFRVPISGLDPDEAKELRLVSMWPSFVQAYHPLVSRKYAVGASKVLLQYIHRGCPKYCVDAIVNGVQSIAKMRAGSAVGFRGSNGGDARAESAVGTASLRLVVMGNYIAELLRTNGNAEHAKTILNKLEILTSAHAPPFHHKTLLRVWTLCNIAMLLADKRLPVAAYEFIHTAHSEALRDDTLASQVVLARARALSISISLSLSSLCSMSPRPPSPLPFLSDTRSSRRWWSPTCARRFSAGAHSSRARRPTSSSRAAAWRA
jgi:hypothetical protein